MQDSVKKTVSRGQRGSVVIGGEPKPTRAQRRSLHPSCSNQIEVFLEDESPDDLDGAEIDQEEGAKVLNAGFEGRKKSRLAVVTDVDAGVMSFTEPRVAWA